MCAQQQRPKTTWADLMISLKGPFLSPSPASSSPTILSSSSIKVCGCKIPFPWSTYLQNPKKKSLKTQNTLLLLIAEYFNNQQHIKHGRSWIVSSHLKYQKEKNIYTPVSQEPNNKIAE